MVLRVSGGCPRVGYDRDEIPASALSLFTTSVTVDIERLVTHLLVFGVLRANDIHPSFPLHDAASITHDLHR